MALEITHMTRVTSSQQPGLTAERDTDPPEFSAMVRGTTSSASANCATAYCSRPVILAPNADSCRATSTSVAPPAGSVRGSLHINCGAAQMLLIYLSDGDLVKDTPLTLALTLTLARSAAKVTM